MEDSLLSTLDTDKLEDISATSIETDQLLNENVKVVKPLPNFWTRVLALIIDSIVLGIFGAIIGSLFFEQFSLLGGWGRLIGFIITVLYFGLLNSNLGKGQSLGKRITKIKVIDEKGELISWKRSFLRATILQLPFILNGAPIGGLITNIPLAVLDGIIVFGIGSGIIYFYIFNSRTRQSLHDIICKTYVVKVTAEKEIDLGSISRYHYYIFVMILLIMAIAAVSINLYFKKNLDYMWPIVENLNKIENVSSANFSVGQNYFYSSNSKTTTTTTYATANVLWRGNPKSIKEAENKVARVILENYPDASNKDVIIVNVSYGFDIGIASSYKNWSARYTAAEWRKMINSN